MSASAWHVTSWQDSSKKKKFRKKKAHSMGGKSYFQWEVYHIFKGRYIILDRICLKKVAILEKHAEVVHTNLS